MKGKNEIKATVPLSQGGKTTQLHLISTEMKHSLTVRAQEPDAAVEFMSMFSLHIVVHACKVRVIVLKH